jgi:hypothetical protein
MNLKEKIKNYTTYIVDDRDNKWEVIELSDLQDLLDTDRAEQLILHGLVEAFHCMAANSQDGFTEEKCKEQCKMCKSGQ